MRKNTRKFNTTKEKTISNTIEKEKGGGVSIHQKQHQGKLKNMRKSTRKFKTTMKKTISNTTKKEMGRAFDSP